MINNLNWLPILALTCVVTLITVSYSYSSPRPFEIYIKSKNDVIREVFCKTEDAQKFARSKVIANIELRIKDFIYTSGDSKYIGINYGEYTRSGKDTTTNKDIHESFIQSVKKYNSEKEYAQYIHEKKMNQIVDCMTNEQMKNPDESHVNKCTAKMNSMVEAKHGNALVRFGCGLQIKGREFPVLVKSSCQIQVGEKRFNGLHKLTDINAFEETTIKDGLKRLLDEYAKNLSEVFEVVKMCK